MEYGLLGLGTMKAITTYNLISLSHRNKNEIQLYVPFLLQIQFWPVARFNLSIRKGDEKKVPAA